MQKNNSRLEPNDCMYLITEDETNIPELLLKTHGVGEPVQSNPWDTDTIINTIIGKVPRCKDIFIDDCLANDGPKYPDQSSIKNANKDTVNDYCPGVGDYKSQKQKGHKKLNSAISKGNTKKKNNKKSKTTKECVTSLSHCEDCDKSRKYLNYLTEFLENLQKRTMSKDYFGVDCPLVAKQKKKQKTRTRNPVMTYSYQTLGKDKEQPAKCADQSIVASSQQKHKTKLRKKNLVPRCACPPPCGDTDPHEKCTDREVMVPKNMGWNWKHNSERKGWKPGAIPKSVREIMGHFMKPCPCDTLPVSNIPNYCQQTTTQSVSKTTDSKLLQRPMIELHREDDELTITMRPLKNSLALKTDPDPYLNCEPIKIKISGAKEMQKLKQIRKILDEKRFKKCSCGRTVAECNCRDSSEMEALRQCLAELEQKFGVKDLDKRNIFKLTSRDLELDFTPPAAILKPHLSCCDPLSMKEVETQYSKDDCQEDKGKKKSKKRSEKGANGDGRNNSVTDSEEQMALYMGKLKGNKNKSGGLSKLQKGSRKPSSLGENKPGTDTGDKSLSGLSKLQKGSRKTSSLGANEPGTDTGDKSTQDPRRSQSPFSNVAASSSCRPCCINIENLLVHSQSCPETFKCCRCRKCSQITSSLKCPFCQVTGNASCRPHCVKFENSLVHSQSSPEPLKKFLCRKCLQSTSASKCPHCPITEKPSCLPHCISIKNSRSQVHPMVQSKSSPEPFKLFRCF